MCKTSHSISETVGPVAIYNSNKKELIGVFSELMLVCKYLYPCSPRKSYDNIYQALKRGGGVLRSIFDFKVSIRHATSKQIEELNNQVVIIKEKYPVFEFNKAIGFRSTKEELHIKCVINHHKRGNQNAKKNG